MHYCTYMRVLAGDVGGTNARLARVDVGQGTARIEQERVYPSADADSLHTIMRQFLRDSDAPMPERACIAIAGPVVDGHVQVTNLPWVVDRDALREKLGVERLDVINDFMAIGHGLDLLGADDLVTLQAGEPVPHGPVAYLGPGTGLGVGFRLWSGDRYRVYASEGGHVDFAPRDQVQAGLTEFLRAAHGRASNERVLSGGGLADVYRYLAQASPKKVQQFVDAEMKREDPAAVVTRHALAGDDVLCGQAVALFVSVLGAVAGNLALIAVATGGVYVTGGIAPRIVPMLREPGFLQAFHDQGRLSTLVARAPVHVVTNTKVGLLGAAGYAARP